MNSKAVFLSLLFVTFLGGSYGFIQKSEYFLDQLANLALSPSNSNKDGENTYAKLDTVTYVLVDTTLFLMQLGKTGLGFTGYIEDPMGPLFDFTFNTTREECADNSCIKNDVFMEFRDTYISGLGTIKLQPDFQPTSLSVTLTVGDLSLGINGYKHTITNTASNNTRVGEGAHFSLRDATYGIKANYTFVPNVGIQLSNVDLTLDIGNELWEIDRRYTILSNGFIVEEGFYSGDLAQDVMSTWRGEIDGKPFEKQYEQWAQFLLNCGLSGGRSSQECSGVKEQLKQYKLRNFPTL